MDNNLFSIGEIAKAVGITRKTILNYESKRLVKPDTIIFEVPAFFIHYLAVLTVPKKSRAILITLQRKVQWFFRKNSLALTQLSGE